MVQLHKYSKHLGYFLRLLLLTSIVPEVTYSVAPDLKTLKLPPGFVISIYHDNIPGARSLTLGSHGTVFVSTRSEGKIYALRDTTKDGTANKIYVIASDLNVPNGIAFYKNNLYVAETNRIIRYPNIENRLSKPSNAIVVYTKLNSKRHHGWRYIAIDKKGSLTISIGAPCNVCTANNTAMIKKINLKTLKTKILARGVRNSVGFDWHPLTGKLWFTDNGRDLMGDDIPPDELNLVTKIGQHFGFPVCHGGNILDPIFGKNKNCNNYQKPAWRFRAHVAPLGIRFYTGTMFPKNYRQQLFVAQHGSWNRSKKVGYRIMLLQLDRRHKTVKSAIPFVSGWLKNEKSSGRPVDLLVMPDGSLLISDDKAGVVYRIIYNEKLVK